MATTTTNFGWDIPQSTDLVKDGATAIAALGQDIDTAFVDFKGGTTGQVLKKTSNTDLDVEWGTASSGLTLINTTSFSGVASVSLPANTFTSTYRNYRILINITSGTTAASIRLRASGTDATGSNYRYSTVYINSSGSVLNNASSASATSIGGAGGLFDTTDNSTNSINLYSPQLAVSTNMDITSMSGSSGLPVFGGGQHDVSSAYDSLTYFAGANISGVIRVYGLAN